MDTERGTTHTQPPEEGSSDLAGQTKQAVTETVKATVETAKGAAQEIAGTIQEQAGQVMEQATSQATDTMKQVKEQAGSIFVDQRDRAVAGLTGLADALRDAARALADQTEGDGAVAVMPAIGPFVEDLANRLGASADFLKDKDVRQLVDDAEALARRQPLLFAAALFGIGVVGARLLKGSTGGDAATGSPAVPQSESKEPATAPSPEQWGNGTTGEPRRDPITGAGGAKTRESVGGSGSINHEVAGAVGVSS